MSTHRQEVDQSRLGYARLGKRVLDLLVSSVGIAVLSPILAIVAIAVKTTSRGPVLFGQSRPGRYGKAFRILKFRSMLTFEDSYDSTGAELSNEQRITRVGRFLRRFSLDELPQLFNVWIGDMSLVGPRPALQYQVDRYDDRQRGRMDVKPGITGLAQVSGRNSLTWEQKIALDLKYVRSLSFKLDISIIFQTFGVVLFGKGISFERYDSLSDHHGDLRRHIGETKGEQ